MVWCELTSTGIIRPYFFDGNVTGESYLAMFESFLWPQIKRRRMLFQQDRTQLIILYRLEIGLMRSFQTSELTERVQLSFLRVLPTYLLVISSCWSTSRISYTANDQLQLSSFAITSLKLALRYQLIYVQKCGKNILKLHWDRRTADAMNNFLIFFYKLNNQINIFNKKYSL